MGTRPSQPHEGVTRLVFADHLRVALVILVVLHHLAVIPFRYWEPPYQGNLALRVLVLFQLLNQAYFMGFLFLLSGYFTPGSFDRKGPTRFLKDRLLRLGIPLAGYTLVLSPIAFIGDYQMLPELTCITKPFTWQQFLRLLGMGPMWFLAMLLIFDVGYAGWRLATKNCAPQSKSGSALPCFQVIGASVLVLALTSYLIRIVLPLGRTVVGFPSLAYLPQYLSFFSVGIVAYRRDWLHSMPSSTGKVGFVVALASTLTLLPLALSVKTDFLGLGHWESGVYALWDSVFSVGMCSGLIVFFRRFLNHQERFGRFVTRQAYTVYIINIPVIVLLTLALRSLELEHLLKLGLATIIGVPLCFAIAFLVRSLPLASRIL